MCEPRDTAISTKEIVDEHDDSALDDHPVWATAVECEAQYVVSDNTSDYPPRQPDGRYVHQGIEYISGRDFLTMLLSDLPD